MNPVIFNDTNDKENYWFFHRMHKVLVETFQDLEFIPPNPNTCETKSIADYESGYYQAFRDIIACVQATHEDLKEVLGDEELGEVGEDDGEKGKRDASPR